MTSSGTEWIWDAGALVRKSVQCGRPVVIVAFKFVFLLLFVCGVNTEVTLKFEQLPTGFVRVCCQSAPA